MQRSSLFPTPFLIAATGICLSFAAHGQSFGGAVDDLCGTVHTPDDGSALNGSGSILGTRHVLVVPIDNDNAAGNLPTHAQLVGLMDDNEDWYDEASYGRFAVHAHDGPAGVGQDSILDWFTTSTTDPELAAAEAILHASNQGVVVEDWDHFVFLQTGEQDPYGGKWYGDLPYEIADGSTIQRDSAMLFKFKVTLRKFKSLVHEIGHSLYLGHAEHYDPRTGLVTGQGYNHEADVMGGGTSVGPVHFSAPAKDYLGWFATDEIEDVVASGVFVLTPMAEAGGLKALRLNAGTHQSEADGYIEYRRPIGFDGYLAGQRNLTDGALVSIRRNKSGVSMDATPESPSFKSEDCALTEGRTYVFEERFAVRVLDHDMVNDELTVEVHIFDPHNRPPVIDDVIVNYTNGLGVSATFEVVAHDPEGDAIHAFWALRGDPFDGDFYEAGDYASGLEVSAVYPFASSTERVFVFVSDERGAESAWMPVDVPWKAGDSIHEVPGEFGTIQSAIDAANHGDWVQIDPGTYSGPGNRNLNFQGKRICVRGQGGSGATVLDAGSQSRGAAFTLGEYWITQLEGLTIRDGEAPGDVGGGVWITNASCPTLRDLRFESNSASWGGGLGIEGARSPFRLRHLDFEGNQANHGGGVAIVGQGPLQADENLERHLAGLIVNDNDAVQGGGVWSNVSIYVSASEVVHNYAAQGGGLFLANFPSRVLDSLVVSNVGQIGGGLYFDYILPYSEVRGCTVSANSSVVGGGAIHTDQANLLVTNAIVWGNTSPGYGTNLGGFLSDLDVEYTDFQDGLATGLGVIDIDPLFLDPAGGDFSLTSVSPCLDRADGDRARSIDLRGNARVDLPLAPNQGAGVPNYVDLGALELQSSTGFGF